MKSLQKELKHMHAYEQVPFNKSLLPITKTTPLIPKEILFLNSIIADKHESTIL